MDEEERFIELELDADRFAGRIMRRLGATLDQALSAFDWMPEAESATHPGRMDRLASVKRGWVEENASLQEQPTQPGVPPAIGSPRDSITPDQCHRLGSHRVLVRTTTDARCLEIKDTFRDCAECPEMVLVPGGSFLMGSPAYEIEKEDFFTGLTGTERPQVQVTIRRPFGVGRFAVTFAEWDACVADNRCNKHQPDDREWGRGSRPVINVSWNHAKSFTKWLSESTGKRYRLLSEAEREYVARAGTTGPFWWGTEINTQRANYNGLLRPYAGSPQGEFRNKTLPVYSFAGNPWGLRNVHGNVWEWTEDCWNDNHAGNPGDGSARTTGVCRLHVMRGGSWSDEPVYLRSAMRNRGTTDEQYTTVGFRVARDLE
jgi:formylglycine-generating enzyme required for sulfatase activity